jgi:hypothetical protein
MDYQNLHDDLIEELQRNIPQEWEASEGSAESIVIDHGAGDRTPADRTRRFARALAG